MKGRRLYALSALALVLGCEDQKVPTAPAARSAPTDPSAMISDGAHGGNPDFFFLPPMVSNPVNNPNFEPGKFNAAIQPSLTVEICELQGSPVDAQGLPVATDCVAGPLVKKFPAGTVQLQGGDPDGFYMVLWKTQESNLSLTKFYRIKVLFEGSNVPFGAADIDPVSNMREFKNARTGETIPLIDDSTLPIKFRVERGAACNGGLCNSVTVTNNSPTGSTIVTLDGGLGAIAGAKFPNGWLPAGGPQSVVVTISSVNTGASDPATGSETIPCHANLPLQQFRGCFNFITTPTLAAIDESGTQFATPVTIAACYVLQGTGDPREKFAEMWASGPNEPPHALPDASDVGILSPNTRNCTSNIVVLNNSEGVTGLASAGWQKVKGGLGRLFGVQTAYAVDLGLGGFATQFSNEGAALSALIAAVGATQLTVPGGGTVFPFVRIVGSNHHDVEHGNSTGIGGLPVAFVASAGTTISPQGTEGGTATQLTATTNTLPIDGSPTSGGGYATVNWTLPSTPGTYTLTATGPALGGPVTFTATVPVPVGLNVLQGTWLNENPSTGNNPRVDISVDGSAVSVHAWGACSPTDCDWGSTSGSTAAWNSNHEITAVWNQIFVISTQTITYLSATRLQIVNHYHFVPPDPRTDFTSSPEFFTMGVVDQSNTAPSNLGANINECCRYIAQTFTAGLTGTLLGVNVNVTSSSAYPLNVAIRTVASGVPTSTILGDRTLSTSGALLSQLITFPQTITLTAGVQYAVVVSYPGAPPPGYGQSQGLWSGTTGDLYTAGALYMSVDGTSWLASGAGNDVQFRTHMSSP